MPVRKVPCARESAGGLLRVVKLEYEHGRLTCGSASLHMLAHFHVCIAQKEGTENVCIGVHR